MAGSLLGGVREPVLERAFDYWKSIDADIGRRIEEKVRHRERHQADRRHGRSLSRRAQARRAMTRPEADARASEWNALARSLRHLHLALLQRARSDYMRDQGISDEIGPGELLMLATRDPAFDWLRSLSELMADIDHFRDAPEAANDPAVRAAVRVAVEGLLKPPDPKESGTPFAQRYWTSVHEEPAVTMAHAAIRQALQTWPQPAGADAGTLAEHRIRTSRARPR